MTEMSGAVTELSPSSHRDPDHPERLTSAGRAWSGVELKIVDPRTDEEAPAREIGEVYVRSRQRMQGYWGKAEATDAAFAPGGWLRSGDAGYLDEDGYLYVRDRIKDLIISGGENIYPAEVERVLVRHPDVAEVAVIGVPDPTWGESVMAVIVPRAGASVERADIETFARRHLAAYKCPRSIDVVPILPRNALGKVLKRELRAPYWAGQERVI
jgi:acyl-CoA synthetase (AMP-forming)/AMP-acid ligase II